MIDLSKISGFVVENAERIPNNEEIGIALLYFFLSIFIFIILLLVAVHIYTSLAYIRIARKTKTEPAWLAWIPIANLYLMSKIAKMHWWPMLFMIPFLLLFPVFFVSKILFLILIIPAMICIIVQTVYWFIWNWKIFERVGKPGWWILLTLVPSAGGILYLVFLGIAAWDDGK